MNYLLHHLFYYLKLIFFLVSVWMVLFLIYCGHIKFLNKNKKKNTIYQACYMIDK